MEGRCSSSAKQTSLLPVTLARRPGGTQSRSVARYCCPDARMTFSLLPRFMAAEPVRPGRGCASPAARRWARRRVERVRLVPAIVIGLFPGTLTGLPILIGEFRRQAGGECALVALRLLCADHFLALPSPGGFRRAAERDDNRSGCGGFPLARPPSDPPNFFCTAEKVA